MKFKNVLSIFLLMFFAGVCIAQVPVVPDTDTSVLVSDEYDLFAEDVDVSTQHERTLDIVKNVVENSNRLRPLQKKRILKRLERNIVATRVTDYIISRSMDEGLIVIDDVVESDVEILIDLDGLIEFIERILPIILQLISLFG